MVFFVSVLFYSLAVPRLDFDEVRNRVLGISNNVDVGIHFCRVGSVAITGFNPALLNFHNVARNGSSCRHRESIRIITWSKDSLDGNSWIEVEPARRSRSILERI